MTETFWYPQLGGRIIVDAQHPGGRIVNTPEEQALVEDYNERMANAATTRENARQALANLRTARTVLAGTPTNAQILQAVRLVVDVEIALVKLEAREFAEAD